MNKYFISIVVFILFVSFTFANHEYHLCQDFGGQAGIKNQDLLIKSLQSTVYCLWSREAHAEPLTSEDMKDLKKRRHMESVVFESYFTPRKVSLLGIHYDQFLSKRIYTGMAAYIAVRGENNVGGYGVLGAKIGVQQPLANWVVYNGQLICGGGGGGGIPTGGGLILRIDSGLGFKLSDSLMLRISGGYLKSFSGGTFKAPLFNVGLSLSSFDLFLPMK